MSKEIRPDMPVVDPLAGQPKTTGGEKVTPEADPNKPPPRARVRRKAGQEPQVVTTRAPVAKLTQPVCGSGHPIADGMKFCPQCGAEIKTEGPAACSNGHAVAPDDKFCSLCGDPLGGEAAEANLTEDQLRAREAAHARAIAMGKENPVITYAPGRAPAEAKTTIIHFLVDGISLFGNVWMRGQEIELWPGHPRWREARMFINMDTATQYRRYGRQIFAPGPWPGEQSYTAGLGRYQQLGAVSGDGTVGQPSEEELRRADDAERRRGRRVPMPLG